MMKKTFLSPSTINLHEDCPRCFYLHMKHEIKRPRGPMPSIAIGMDSVLKKHFNYYRQTGELPPVLKKFMEGSLIKFLKPTYFHDISKGYCLLGKLDDCLVCRDGTHSPLDHKTRANPTDYIHPTYQLQMEIYSILLNGNGLPANGLAYLIYYCPEKMLPGEEEKIDFITDIKRVDIDLAHGEKAIERAIGCLEGNVLPEASPKCEYCRWVKNAGSLPASGNKELRQEEKTGMPVKNTQADEEEKEPEKEYKDSLF